MSLLDNKIISYTDNIKELPDRPSDEGISAEALKAVFDGRTDNEVKSSINNIIDELTLPQAAAQIGADIYGVTAKNIQGVLDSFHETLNTHDRLLDEDAQTLEQIKAVKADKVAGAAAGDITALDAGGNLTSSGYTLKNMLATTVLAETSSSVSLRTVSIPGLTSYSQLLNIPLTIRANANGAAGAVSVNINALGTRTVSFPDIGGALSAAAPDGWVATGQDYTVTFNGTGFIISSVNSVGASVSRAGLVQLNNSVTSTSETQAATPKAVKQAYDFVLTRPSEAPADGAQYGRQNGAWTVITGGGGGTSDHSQLTNRNIANQHTIGAVTGLEENLNGLDDALEYMRLNAMVWDETSSSGTVRTVSIPNITDLSMIQNVPLYIRAKVFGENANTTLNINWLGAKYLVFPDPASSLSTPKPPVDWVRQGGIYCVVYDGTYFYVLNTQPGAASISYAGLVRLENTTTSTLTNRAATANAVKMTYDKATSTLVTATLTAAGWAGSAAPFTCALTVSGVTTTNVNELLPSATITAAQLEAYQMANIQDGGQAANSITLKAWGEKPTIDIPVRIIVRRDI